MNCEDFKNLSLQRIHTIKKIKSLARRLSSDDPDEIFMPMAERLQKLVDDSVDLTNLIANFVFADSPCLRPKPPLKIIKKKKEKN
jgi:hypothetical protein